MNIANAYYQVTNSSYTVISSGKFTQAAVNKV